MFRVPDDWVASGPHDDCIPSTYQQRARTGPGRIKDQSFPAMVGGSSRQTRHSTHWLQISVSGYDGMVEPGLDTSVHFTARPAAVVPPAPAGLSWPALHQPAASCTDGRGCQALPEQCAAATATNHTTFICHSHYNLLLLLTRDCSQHPASIL